MTAFDILHRVIQPEKGGWDENAARAILSFSFSEMDLERLHVLLEMSKWDILDEDARLELMSYQKAGNILGLMKSRARISLSQIIEERPME